MTEKLETCRKAIEKFGIVAQIGKMHEEMCELGVALEHWKRDRCKKEDVVTEIADVMIVAAQMAIYFGKEAVDAEIDRKLERLEGKMKEESEDEKRRRRMVEHFKSKTKETWCGIPVKDILKWLEKQKENPKSADSIPSDCASDAKNENEHNESGDFVFELRQIISRHWYADEFSYRVDDEEGMASEIMSLCGKQKEKTEELSTRLNGLMQEYVYAGKDEEEQEHRLKCYQLFWDALEDSEFFKQKEQKPVILGPDETEFPYNHPANTLEGEIKNIWSKLSRENAFVASFEGFREVILHFLNFIQKDQKPEEWSEREKGILLECVSALQNSSHWLLADKLSSLRPQPKQESEPIEIKYAGKIYKVYGTKELPGGVVGYIIEDEHGHYDCILNPDEVLGGGYGIKSNGSPYPTKEANFGQPHWKPSEEQMEWLESAVRLSTNKPRIHGIIISLYNDLKTKVI